MTEAAPAAPAAAAAAGPAVKGPAPKDKASASTSRPAVASVTELLTQAVSASKERSGVSLAALKKSLSASGYDVEKNNSRIKLALKSLVSKGVMVQIKGTGASGSFRLGKQPVEAAAKKASKAKKSASTAAKAKKTPGAKKAVKSPKKPAAVKAKKAVKSPAKAAKPKVKPKTPKAKVAKPKKAPAQK